MSTEYRDRWIELTKDEVVIHGYYFPWGTKRIPYSSIRTVQRVDLGLLNGRARIWGTANPRYWAGLDPSRPAKRTGFVIDSGHAVKPLITPDDAEAAGACLRANLAPGVLTESPQRGPLI
jgi:hypothetical protein